MAGGTPKWVTLCPEGQGEDPVAQSPRRVHTTVAVPVSEAARAASWAKGDAP